VKASWLPRPVTHGVFEPPKGAEHIYVGLVDGRHLMVTPMNHGAGVLLSIVGKRGGLVDYAQVGHGSIARLIFVVDEMAQVIEAPRAKFERRKQQELERRLRKGHEGNPFTPEYKGPNPGRFKTAIAEPEDVRYLVRPR
jgi:hypothetical protein